MLQRVSRCPLWPAVTYSVLLQICHVCSRTCRNRSHTAFTSCAWLLSPNIVFWRFVHVVEHNNNRYLFIAEENPTLWMYHILVPSVSLASALMFWPGAPEGHPLCVAPYPMPLVPDPWRTHIKYPWVSSHFLKAIPPRGSQWHILPGHWLCRDAHPTIQPQRQGRKLQVGQSGYFSRLGAKYLQNVTCWSAEYVCEIHTCPKLQLYK